MHANPYIGVKVWLGGIIKNNLINKILKIGQEILERKPKEISFLFFIVTSM